MEIWGFVTSFFHLPTTRTPHFDESKESLPIESKGDKGGVNSDKKGGRGRPKGNSPQKRVVPRASSKGPWYGDGSGKAGGGAPDGRDFFE